MEYGIPKLTYTTFAYIRILQSFCFSAYKYIQIYTPVQQGYSNDYNLVHLYIKKGKFNILIWK